MDESSKRQGVVMTHGSLPATFGEVALMTLSRRERVIRGVKICAYCWLAAFAAVFLPVLHFFLVPSLLLAGPLLGLWRSRQKSLILGGTGACPSCQASLEIPKSPEKWPIEGACMACRRQYEANKTKK